MENPVPVQAAPQELFVIPIPSCWKKWNPDPVQTSPAKFGQTPWFLSPVPYNLVKFDISSTPSKPVPWFCDPAVFIPWFLVQRDILFRSAVRPSHLEGRKSCFRTLPATIVFFMFNIFYSYFQCGKLLLDYALKKSISHRERGADEQPYNWCEYQTQQTAGAVPIFSQVFTPRPKTLSQWAEWNTRKHFSQFNDWQSAARTHGVSEEIPSYFQPRHAAGNTMCDVIPVKLSGVCF